MPDPDSLSPDTFLPLLAERFARQRLKALAKVEGRHDDGLPVVLFLCTHKTVGEVRPVRDELERRVRSLLAQLDVPVVT